MSLENSGTSAGRAGTAPRHQPIVRRSGAGPQLVSGGGPAKQAGLPEFAHHIARAAPPDNERNARDAAPSKHDSRRHHASAKQEAAGGNNAYCAVPDDALLDQPTAGLPDDNSAPAIWNSTSPPSELLLVEAPDFAPSSARVSPASDALSSLNGLAENTAGSLTNLESLPEAANSPRPTDGLSEPPTSTALGNPAPTPLDQAAGDAARADFSNDTGAGSPATHELLLTPSLGTLLPEQMFAAGTLTGDSASEVGGATSLLPSGQTVKLSADKALGLLPGDPLVGTGSSSPTSLGESGIATPYSTHAAAQAPGVANGAGISGSAPAVAIRLTESESAPGVARREARGGPSGHVGAARTDSADAAQPWAGTAQASPQTDAPPAAAATATSSGRATFISPAQVPARVAQLAAALGEPGARSVRLRLDPPSLGEIRVHIESSSQGITVRIVAQSHEACALLSDHHSELGRELGRQGLTLHSFSTSLAGQGSGGQPADREPSKPRSRASRGTSTDSVTLPAESVHALAPRGPTRGLDARV
jgi:hypothetical protein